MCLVRIDYVTSLGFGDFALSDGCSGAIRSYEPPSASSRVAWCSSLSLSGPDTQTYSIAVWNAPTTEVPHFWVAMGVRDGEISLEVRSAQNRAESVRGCGTLC